MPDVILPIIMIILIMGLGFYRQRPHTLLFKRIAPTLAGTYGYKNFSPCLSFTYQGLKCEVLTLIAHKRRKSLTLFQFELPNNRDFSMQIIPSGAASSLKRMMGQTEVKGISVAFDTAFEVISQQEKKVRSCLNEELQSVLLEYRHSLKRIQIRGTRVSFQINRTLKSESEYLTFIDAGKLLVDQCYKSN